MDFILYWTFKNWKCVISEDPQLLVTSVLILT